MLLFFLVVFDRSSLKTQLNVLCIPVSQLYREGSGVARNYLQGSWWELWVTKWNYNLWSYVCNFI